MTCCVLVGLQFNPLLHYNTLEWVSSKGDCFGWFLGGCTTQQSLFRTDVIIDFMLGVILWALLRLLTSFFGLVFTELQSPSAGQGLFWPVQGNWLEKYFLGPLQHWDTAWYVQIVTQGYQANDGTAQFHPLYPL